MSSTSAFQRARQGRVVGAILCLLMTVVVAYLSLYTVRGQNLDTLAMEALMQRAYLIPESIRGITGFDPAPAVVLSCVIVGLVALLRRRVSLGLRALVVICGSNLTSQGIKMILSRPSLNVGVDLGNSFPSGHATFAASVAAALVLVAPRGFRAVFAFLGGICAAVMGQVVMVQGWHRPSDVMGAMLIVAVWTLLLAPVEEGSRVLPAVQRVAGVVAWVLLVISVAVWLLAIAGLWPDVGRPLSSYEISSWTGLGTRTGRWLAGASLLFPLGIEGVVLSTVSRLRRNAVDS